MSSESAPAKCTTTTTSILSWKCPAKTGAVFGSLLVSYLILESDGPLGWALALTLWVLIPAGLLVKFGAVKLPESQCSCDVSKFAPCITETATKVYEKTRDLLAWKDAMASAQAFVLLYIALAVVDTIGLSNVVLLSLLVTFSAIPVYTRVSQADVSGEIANRYEESVKPTVETAKAQAEKYYTEVSKVTMEDLLSWKCNTASGVALAAVNVAVIFVSFALCWATSMMVQLVVLVFAASFVAKSFNVEMPACNCDCDVAAKCEKVLAKALTVGQTFFQKSRDIVLWTSPAQTVRVFFGLKLFGFFLWAFGLTGLVLITLNAYAVAPVVVRHPVYVEKVQPVVEKIQPFVAKVQEYATGMVERVSKAKAE